MTDDLALVRRIELRKRAEWILEHHPTHPPARILVPVDDMLALLDALDAADATIARARAALAAMTGEHGPMSNREDDYAAGWEHAIADVSDALTDPDPSRARRDAHLGALMRDELDPVPGAMHLGPDDDTPGR